ncbi:MAG: hypothetical protein R3298_10880 [Gammaproteobacteria bacterium]|nr:hypothetical protein [Gammaproteobacteria bacterium]
MSDATYDVLFYGVVKPGHDPEQARDNLATLFKADRSKVDPLFSGNEVAIKRGVDETTAKRYQAAFAQAGLVVQLRETATAAGDAAGTDGPTVAESGSRLSPESAPPPPAPDTDHLSAAETGADVLEGYEPEPPPPAPNVDHLSASGDVADLLEGVEREPPPPPPDISHLSAAEAGADVLEGYATESPPPEAPDTSHLSTAEAGSDLLEKDEEETSPSPPETGHLGLADDETTR